VSVSLSITKASAHFAAKSTPRVTNGDGSFAAIVRLQQYQRASNYYVIDVAGHFANQHLINTIGL